MNEILEFLIQHGAVVLFVALLIEQVGLPFPATPVLLFAGALAGAAKLHWAPLLISGVLGSLVADVIWFYIGAFKGQRALKLLCRISLNPDSCVRRTQEAFGKYGMAGLIFGKFIPGISTLLPPLAGSSGLSLSRFLLFDGISSLLYCGSFIFIGFLFSNQVEEIIAALNSLGKGAFAVGITFLASYVAYKYFQRQRLLRELRMARITVDELLQKQEAGENPVILDLRSHLDVKLNPLRIRGALHMTMEEVQLREQEIPRDRDIILYCSCPNEETSARVALSLHRRGILRVRPLLGGLDAWQERSYPTELHTVGRGSSMGVASDNPWKSSAVVDL